MGSISVKLIWRIIDFIHNDNFISQNSAFEVAYWWRSKNKNFLYHHACYSIFNSFYFDGIQFVNSSWYTKLHDIKICHHSIIESFLACYWPLLDDQRKICFLFFFFIKFSFIFLFISNYMVVTFSFSFLPSTLKKKKKDNYTLFFSSYTFSYYYEHFLH